MIAMHPVELNSCTTPVQFNVLFSFDLFKIPINKILFINQNYMKLLF